METISPINLRQLAAQVRDQNDENLIQICYDYSSREYQVKTGEDVYWGLYSRWFSFLPGNATEIKRNNETYGHLVNVFPKSACTRVFPSHYHSGVPIKIGQVRALLFSSQMPLITDIEELAKREGRTNSETFSRITCLQPEDLWATPHNIPPFCSDHGETLPGIAQVVAVNKIALRNLRGITAPTSFDQDQFWINSLKRCFGPRTPKGLVIDTPDGLYCCTHKEVAYECKYLIFTPIERVDAPHRVIFLQTQTTLESFQANLDPEIGGIGVMQVADKLQRSINSEGKYVFMGYSLGGIQAYLMTLLFPKHVSELFCVSNPGTTEKIRSWSYKYLPRLRGEEPPLNVKIYHDREDLIPYMGAKQPFYKADNEEDTAFRWTCSYISSSGREGVNRLRGIPANIFDILRALLESFWKYHPQLHLDPEKVRISDIIRDSGDREPFGLEPLLGICGSYFGRKSTFYNELKRWHEKDIPLVEYREEEVISPSRFGTPVMIPLLKTFSR